MFNLSNSNLPVAQLDNIADNEALYNNENFAQRAEAIEFIEFELIAGLEYRLMNAVEKHGLTSLKKRAEKAKLGLEAVNVKLFKELRANIRTGLFAGRAFKTLVKQYIDFDLTNRQIQETPGYDDLDVFINNLIHTGKMPEQTLPLEPEMVYYQKTPARIIFELVDFVNFTNNDVFFDLGSGLGQVAILVNLLTGVKAIGIEFEPAFCIYAASCAASLNLRGVSFFNTDARKTDYSNGTVFFMFTPFRAEILQEVLMALKNESLKRQITIISYGPCTADVAMQSWLRSKDAKEVHDYRLKIFNSL